MINYPDINRIAATSDIREKQSQHAINVFAMFSRATDAAIARFYVVLSSRLIVYFRSTVCSFGTT